MNKIPTLNQDGYSVRGCNIIYAPKGQAGEYSRLAANPYDGCGHKCRYCYVPAVRHITRAEFDAGAEERASYLQRLVKDARKYQELGIREQVLLCFTTDPYHPFETSLTRSTIEVLIEHGLDFCTLTKGGGRALRDLDLFRPERDAFASSLTLLDDAASRKWEPDAALPADRIATLKRFSEAGIYTWVSLEPVIVPEVTLEIIRLTHPFVKLFKVGRMNYNPLTKSINWKEFTDRARDVLAPTSSDYYFKEDLQPHLPVGYRNDKYRPQRRELPVINAQMMRGDGH
jgi:DNA repair photolyase